MEVDVWLRCFARTESVSMNAARHPTVTLHFGLLSLLCLLRSTQLEEYDLITLAKPKDQKASSQFEGALRGGGSKFVMVGNIFSNLYCEIKDENERTAPKEVRQIAAHACVVPGDVGAQHTRVVEKGHACILFFANRDGCGQFAPCLSAGRSFGGPDECCTPMRQVLPTTAPACLERKSMTAPNLVMVS